jgi:hypothetical protein
MPVITQILFLVSYQIFIFLQNPSSRIFYIFVKFCYTGNRCQEIFSHDIRHIHALCVCVAGQHCPRTLVHGDTMSELNAEILKTLLAIQANQELLLAQSGDKHEFIQPKAGKKKAKKTELPKWDFLRAGKGKAKPQVKAKPKAKSLAKQSFDGAKLLMKSCGYLADFHKAFKAYKEKHNLVGTVEKERYYEAYVACYKTMPFVVTS